MWKSFKEFAFKGNVMDMAVGVMIGAAFGKIVSSLVGDVIMPLLSTVTGRVDLSGLSATLGEGESAPVLGYGAFLQTVVDFLIIAVCVFLVVRGIGAMRKRFEKTETAEAAPAEPPTMCPFCDTQISPKAIRCPHCASDLTGARQGG